MKRLLLVFAASVTAYFSLMSNVAINTKPLLQAVDTVGILNYSTSFESGGKLQGYFNGSSICLPSSLDTTSLIPAGDGKKCIRVTVSAVDPTCQFSKRAELVASLSGRNWIRYKFKIFLPKSFVYDTDPVLFWQLHDNGKYGGLYPSTKNPVISLNVSKGQWYLEQRYNNIEVTNGQEPIKRNVYLGAAVNNIWHDIEVLTILRTDTTGMTKVRIDGVTKYYRIGANFNTENGVPQRQPTLKTGEYIYRWQNNKPRISPAVRTLYLDKLEMYN